jgi:hypothetical protein
VEGAEVVEEHCDVGVDWLLGWLVGCIGVGVDVDVCEDCEDFVWCSEFVVCSELFILCVVGGLA